MTEEQEKKDYFSFYVAGVALIFVAVIGAIKLSENDKFAPIKEHLQQESAQMNIRIVSTEDYEL